MLNNVKKFLEHLNITCEVLHIAIHLRSGSLDYFISPLSCSGFGLQKM